YILHTRIETRTSGCETFYPWLKPTRAFHIPIYITNLACTSLSNQQLVFTCPPLYPHYLVSSLPIWCMFQVGALCFQIGIPEIPYWRTSQEFVSQAMQLPLPHWVSISSLHAAVTSWVPATLGPRIERSKFGNVRRTVLPSMVTRYRACV